jgi:hypothetical protein
MDVVGDDHAKIRSQKKDKKAAKMVDIFVSILGEVSHLPKFIQTSTRYR